MVLYFCAKISQKANTEKNYPWGKKGKNSLAARYAAATPGGHFKLDESKEYAEVRSSCNRLDQIVNSCSICALFV